MIPSASFNPLVFRDNSEWLRYAFAGGAIGLAALAGNNVVGSGYDIGKVIGGSLGALLMGFSAYALQVRRLVLDPARREITVRSKGLAKTVADRCRFDEVTKLLVVRTDERDDQLLPAHRQSERWSVMLVLKDRAIPVTISPYISKDRAMRDAGRIQQLLNVEIADNVDESIAHLVSTGRIIDAVLLTRQRSGMSLTQAKDHIDRLAGRRPPAA